MLKSWPLAVTGYNHGPSGVRRLTRKYKTRDIAELVDARHGRFRFASANFYASFLASVEVEKRANEFFKNPRWLLPLVGEEIHLSRSLPSSLILDWFNGGLEEAKLYNPHVRRNVWREGGWLGRRNFLRLPLDQVKEARLAMSQFKSHKAKSGDRSYRVQSGETLSEIAMNFGVNLDLLKEINGIDDPRRVRAGQKLLLPPKE
jgi:membrane-bound lytic murein transglycosylase D